MPSLSADFLQSSGLLHSSPVWGGMKYQSVRRHHFLQILHLSPATEVAWVPTNQPNRRADRRLHLGRNRSTQPWTSQATAAAAIAADRVSSINAPDIVHSKYSRVVTPSSLGPRCAKGGQRSSKSPSWLPPNNRINCCSDHRPSGVLSFGFGKRKNV